MKNKIKYIMFGIIIGVVLSGTISYGATVIDSKNVKYNSSDVNTSITDLFSKSKYGNADKSQILNGKTALVNGSQVTGTMPNNKAETKTILPGDTYTIPVGYHSGSGTVKTPKLDFTSFTQRSEECDYEYKFTDSHKYAIFVSFASNGSFSNLGIGQAMDERVIYGINGSVHIYKAENIQIGQSIHVQWTNGNHCYTFVYPSRDAL